MAPFIKVLGSFSLALFLSFCVNAEAQQDSSPFRESDGARLAATEILTLLHMARMYEEQKGDEAAELVNSQVYALIAIMEKLEGAFPRDEDFERLKGKTVLRVKERWGKGIPGYVDSQMVKYIDEQCEKSPICREGVKAKKPVQESEPTQR